MTNVEFLIRKGGYSPTSLSREVGASPSTIIRWMNGKCLPRRGLLLRLASTLGCSMEDVVNVRVLD